MSRQWIQGVLATVLVATSSMAWSENYEVKVDRQDKQPIEVAVNEVGKSLELEVKFNDDFGGVNGFINRLKRPNRFSLLSVSFEFEGDWKDQHPFSKDDIKSLLSVLGGGHVEDSIIDPAGLTLVFKRSQPQLEDNAVVRAGDTFLKIAVDPPANAGTVLVSRVKFGDDEEFDFKTKAEFDENTFEDVLVPVARISVAAVVPEPETALLVMAGLGLVAVALRRQRQV